MLGQVMLGQVPPQRPLDGLSTRDSIYSLTHDACQAFAASIRQLAFLESAGCAQSNFIVAAMREAACRKPTQNTSKITSSKNTSNEIFSDRLRPGRT
jgi:hypothetical protein